MLHPVGFWAAAGGAAPTVNALATNITNSSSISDVYAATSYNSDGNEYTNSPKTTLNYTSSRGNAWLTGGNASDVWVQCTLNSGSFNAANAGTGTRLNLGTTRNWAVSDSNPTAGSKGEANATWAFYDAATGGNLLDSVTYTITAAYTDACPLCCFTPDTPITMADGTTRMIGEIIEGDLIRVRNGIEPVKGVLIRKNRPMYMVTLANERRLHLSAEHPIYVDGKGYAAIDPVDDYKDMGKAGQLEVNDLVVTLDGTSVVLSIEERPYPGNVYTLANSHFFANGILVY